MTVESIWPVALNAEMKGTQEGGRNKLRPSRLRVSRSAFSGDYSHSRTTRKPTSNTVCHGS